MFFLRSFLFHCLKANPECVNRKTGIQISFFYLVFINNPPPFPFLLTRETFLVLLAERENSTPPIARPSSSTFSFTATVPCFYLILSRRL